MRTFFALLLLISILLLPYSVGEAQQQDTIERNELEETVMLYINALNLRDYQTAYAMISPQNQTYEDYVAGYAQRQNASFHISDVSESQQARLT